MQSTRARSERHPGRDWLALSQADRRIYLQGVIEGLNSGIRFCSQEMAFALYSRMSGELDEENSLALSSILNQARNWAKSGLTVMQYSRSIDDYEHILSTFYSNHPKFQPLAPGYLMIFMDDHHGMEADALYNLHEHSLQGFRL